MIIREREYYRNLVTSEYRGGKKFNAMIRKMVDYNCLLDRSILSIVDRFDVETAAVSYTHLIQATFKTTWVILTKNTYRLSRTEK